MGKSAGIKPFALPFRLMTPLDCSLATRDLSALPCVALSIAMLGTLTIGVAVDFFRGKSLLLCSDFILLRPRERNAYQLPRNVVSESLILKGSTLRGLPMV
jgi:hypothetical protein